MNSLYIQARPIDLRLLKSISFSFVLAKYSGQTLTLMGHLIDTDRHRQDDDIVLAGRYLDPIGIPNAKPFPGDLAHLVSPFANFVLRNKFPSRERLPT